VVAAEVNSAPVLPVQTNRVIPPMTLLVVTNKATDTDLPANPLGYTLASGPAGAAIDAKGVVTWTPTQAQNNTTNTFTTVVTDSNGWAAYAQQLSATNSFVVVVTSSQRMVLDGTTLVTEECQPANHAIDPGETVTVLFGLKNIGTASTTNLVARLLAGNGVVLPSSPQRYGAVLAGGPTVSQPFTFTAQGTCGSALMVTLQLQDGDLDLGTVSVSLPLGLNTTIWAENFDAVTAPALAVGWSSSTSGGQSAWITQTSVRDSTPNAAFSPDATNAGLNELVSPLRVLPVGPCQLSFRHYYHLETSPGTQGYDGGVLEMKTGTGTFTDILAAGGSFASGGYNKTLDTRYNNPLAGRQAWSGDSGGFITTVVNLPTGAAGKTVQFRWQCSTDDGGTSGNGWFVDTVILTGPVCCLGAVPVIQSIRLSGSTVTLGCSAVVGRSYRVQYKGSLTETTWNNVSPDYQAATSTLWITNPLSGPQRFYRVVLLP
ncbi:MAG TPA: hypothetical protein VNZ22_21760, partial [Bacillota bacterium]|nr:hypothetical protein [Bacillota bacterium]